MICLRAPVRGAALSRLNAAARPHERQVWPLDGPRLLIALRTDAPLALNACNSVTDMLNVRTPRRGEYGCALPEVSVANEN